MKDTLIGALVVVLLVVVMWFYFATIIEVHHRDSMNGAIATPVGGG